jgi:hypothetical protein
MAVLAQGPQTDNFLGQSFTRPPQEEGRLWIIYVLVPVKAHLYALAHTHSLLILKTLNHTQEKKKELPISRS